VLTGSRGGMIAWMVALTIIPLTMSLSPGRLAGVIGLLGLSAVLVAAYVPDRIVERLGSTTTSVETRSLGGRFRLWKAGIHAFAHRPVMGYGVGSYKMAITPEVGDDALVAHNSYLSVLVEEGMVGLILYMTMLFSVVSAVRHLPRLERRFGLVLLTTLGTAMLPLTWEDQKQVWFITAVMIGMASLGRRPSASVGRADAVDAPRARPVAVEAVQRAMARGPRIEGELGAGG
jgi:O-antigen ligase